MDLPSRHKAAVIKNVDNGPQFEVTHQPLPQPGPTDLLVRLSATGICGTDFALASGELGPTCAILGHEGIGRVVQRGSTIEESSVKLGQRVGISWVRDFCGGCTACLREGEEPRCLKQIHSGRKVDGTFAEYTVIPHRYMIKLPEGPHDEDLAPIMCAGVTAYKALKVCGAEVGDWIVLSGAGGALGSLGIQYARAMGYRPIAIDAGDEKKGHCEGLGAEAYVDVTKDIDACATVKRITGGQGASAILVIAGSGRAYQDAFGMLAPFGTLVCVGIPPPSQLVKFHPLAFIDNGFRVIGSMVGTREDTQEAVRYVERGLIKPTVHIRTLDQINDITQLYMSHQTTGKFVMKIEYQCN